MLQTSKEQDMSKDQISKLLKQEREWTAMFDSDVRVGLALLDELRKLSKAPLSFEQWYELNYFEVSVDCAESGADREMGFDLEREMEDRYERFIQCQELNQRR